MNKFFSFTLFFTFLFIGCSEIRIVEKGDFVDEAEPNDQGFQANEIKEGNIYRAKIAKPAGETPDKDVFKIWKPAGTLITFEFESDESSFLPYIGHTDNLAHAQFVTFKTPGKFRAEFITSIDGWQYFEIGDRRNTSDKEKVQGDFTYYFRIISKHICGEDDYYNELKSLDKLERSFVNSVSSVDILKMNIEENGIYQLRVLTEEMFSDKFTFVFNCDAGISVAGSDDEDYYSNLMDPLIYSVFESNLKNLVVTGRLLTDLDAAGIEKFTISLKQQPPGRELEPNNLFNYANILNSDRMEGELSPEWQTILGENVPDQDWFRIDLQKGEIIDFSIKTGNGGVFSSEIWAGSYSQTGTSILPLRFNRLSGAETHRMNMMMPFSGTAYLLLDGRDIPYSIKIARHNEMVDMLSFKGRSQEIIEPRECEWQFFKWNMPKSHDFFEISLVSLTNRGGIHIFRSDSKPLAFLEPSQTNRFFVHRYELTETLYFGIYFGQCEQYAGETMKFRVTGVDQKLKEWEEGYLQSAVKYSGNGSYQGFFDTDNLLVENFFEIEVPYDGTLYLATAPFRETTPFDIDTVITLYKGSDTAGENDDVISFINYNKYSYLKKEVKKGEKYTAKVMPFMTESSHIPSMKITGHYILDIIIK